MKRSWVHTLLATGTSFAAVAAADPHNRPNIILVFTDDHGYADLGVYGADPDVRTPHLDQLARDGVLFNRGYVTAPQCIPSRAGLIAGRHQNVFGLDDNHGGPLCHDEYTIAERLRDIGYVTGMIGKWHLEIGFDENNQVYFDHESMPHRHGFEEMFSGMMQQYHATYDLDGNDLPGEYQLLNDRHYRVDIQTRAALAFLERHKSDDRPFFLYLCWFAPHSPIEGPPQYMERLAHVEEPIRRKALASILAMDDGMGLIRDRLEEMELTENTLIFYISDNGAPLVEGGYIGSYNTPMVGEKGMQTDGGQRVPFIATWPGRIPAGQVFDEMVWALDASATTLAVAGAPLDDRIEGVNLMPWLTGEKSGPVHESLYWRWRSQSAILTRDWKFIRLGNERRYLFDMREAGRETAADNRIAEHPEIAVELENRLSAIADTWATPGLPDQTVSADVLFFDMHVDRNRPPPPMEGGRTCAHIPWNPDRPQTRPDAPSAVWNAAARPAPVPVASSTEAERRPQGWFVRQGVAQEGPVGLRMVSTRPAVRTFFGRAFDPPMAAPVTVRIEARAEQATTLRLMWMGASGRTESDFVTEPVAELQIAAGEEWTSARAEMRNDEPIRLLRILLEGEGEIPVEVRRIRIEGADGSVHAVSFE